MTKKIIIMLTLGLLVFNILWSETREPAVAGQWYPANKKELEKMLNGFFKNVKLDKEKQKITPFGILSPHAGYIFSGQVAAYGYSLLKDKHYDTVILFGPSHHYNTGYVSAYDGDYYKTPLGTVPIDKEIVSKILKADKKFKFQEFVHRPEHSIEAQVPFLQHQLKDFKIVPILVATNDLPLLDKLAETIINIIEKSDKKILLIASSDMSHYHDYQTAVKMDRHTIDLIQKKKWATLQQDIFSRKSELCGYFGFYVFTKVLQHFECPQGVLLKYSNSGDAMGDTTSTRVVGYCSIVFPKIPTTESELSPSDKEYLLNLARRSIEYYLDNKEIIKPEKPESKILNEDRAVFVTLTKNHNLRGCIGQLIAQMPFYQAVAEMAVSAAFQDYRFNPVKRNELKNISIEISVITPMKRVKSIDEIKMGRDGVYIKKGMRTGVFLPQVAQETGWDK
ncbi:MAG: AmmeMemoRadiSam system protein B, partial [Candidatus Cloacimonadota bacterium]|nr:AmmeMemoRadiSam system protein B [Candidatus Cloacimonadota bacterium]